MTATLPQALDGLDVETLVTGCANCRIVVEEGLEHYEMDVPLEGLTELIAQYLPENKHGSG